MRIHEFENDFQQRLDASQGPAASESEPNSAVRNALKELASIRFDAGSFEVAEDVLAFEANPLGEDSDQPVSFGVIAVRRLFLRADRDEPTSAVEFGFECEISPAVGLAMSARFETSRDLPDGEEQRAGAVTEFLAEFDASELGQNPDLGQMELEAFIQDHNEILD